MDPEWWIEPDILFENYQGDRRPQDIANTEMTSSRADDLRAKIFCYECPLLDACREASWDEGYHVFGGMDANERYKVRSVGDYTALPSPRPRYGKHDWRERPGVKRFLAGDSLDDIARELGVTPATILDTMRGVLSTLRSTREGSEEWRSQQPLPPSLEMSRESFRHGRAVSSTSEAESA